MTTDSGGVLRWSEAIHASLVPVPKASPPTGLVPQVLFWGWEDSSAQLWDPTTPPNDPRGTLTNVPLIRSALPGYQRCQTFPVGTDTIFCSGHNFLDDPWGRLLVTGGWINDGHHVHGPRENFIFDPAGVNITNGWRGAMWRWATCAVC